MSFSYDARGNLTTGDGLTATYNTRDKPTRLTRSKQGISTTMAFTYGADLMRYKQVRTTDGISSITYYIDKLYEETHSAGRTEWKAYISEVAVVGETQQQGRYIAFTHKDRLGSGTTFTDHHGQVTALRTFDPFGKPGGNDGASLSNTTLDNLDQSRRGFTDHDHLDEIDIIHMNGRVYDYNLGRFLSVDPLLHEGSQGINPYSYLMNNPLAGTDPTGYEPEKETIEVSKGAQVFSDADGNKYVSAGDRSGDYIKVDSISSTSGNTQITQNFGDNGQIISFSATNSAGTLNVTDLGSQQQVATFTASDNSTNASVPKEGGEHPNDNQMTGDNTQPERSFWDNPGRHLPSAPQGLVDFVAGFGDSLPFNLTKHVRDFADIDSVDTDSDNYGYGNTTESLVTRRSEL